MFCFHSRSKSLCRIVGDVFAGYVPGFAQKVSCGVHYNSRIAVASSSECGVTTKVNVVNEHSTSFMGGGIWTFFPNFYRSVFFPQEFSIIITRFK